MVRSRTNVAGTCGGGVDPGGLLGSVPLKWFAKDFGAAIAEPLAAKIATAEHAVSSAGVDFPPRKFIVSPRLRSSPHYSSRAGGCGVTI